MYTKAGVRDQRETLHTLRESRGRASTISEASKGASSSTITYGRMMAATVPPRIRPPPYASEHLSPCLPVRAER
jgi:hypothetical protein